MEKTVASKIRDPLDFRVSDWHWSLCIVYWLIRRTVVHSVMTISHGDLTLKPFRFQKATEASVSWTGLKSVLLFETTEYISKFRHILQIAYMVTISLAIGKLTDASPRSWFFNHVIQWNGPFLGLRYRFHQSSEVQLYLLRRLRHFTGTSLKLRPSRTCRQRWLWTWRRVMSIRLTTFADSFKSRNAFTSGS